MGGLTVGFLIEVWISFWALSAVEKLTTVLSLSPFVAVIYAFVRATIRKRTRLLHDEIDALQRQVSSLGGQRIQLTGDLEKLQLHVAVLEHQLPETALSIAQKERTSGNEERAVSALRDNFESMKFGFSKICTELSIHHAALTPDLGKHHFSEARRLVEIAINLTPDNSEAILLRIELAEIGAELEHSDGVYDPLESKWDDARFFMYLDSHSDAAAAFEVLVNAGELENRAGRYRRAERILSRACTLGVRLFGPLDPKALEARWPWFFAVDMLEYDQAALDAATWLSDHLEPDTKIWAGAEFYRCGALLGLGFLTEALTRIRRNIDIWTKLSGAEHRETLANRHLRVHILETSGEWFGALSEIESLIPIKIGVSGGDNHETITFKLTRFRLLLKLEKTEAAFYGVNELLKIDESVLSSDHPVRFAIRLARVDALFRLGKLQVALDEILSLLSEGSPSGSDHKGVFSPRAIYARLLSATGNKRGALSEVSALLPLMERSLRANHPDILDVRKTRIDILLAMGEVGSAANELSALLPVIENVFGPNHVSTIGVQILRARIWQRTGRKLDAISFLKSIVPGLKDTLGEQFSLTREAMQIINEIEQK